MAYSRTAPTSTAVQNPIPECNVQPVAKLVQSMTKLVQTLTAASSIPVGKPVSDIQSAVTGTGTCVQGMASAGTGTFVQGMASAGTGTCMQGVASAGPGSTVPPTPSYGEDLQPGPPAAPSFWNLLNSTSSDVGALKKRMSSVVPQTSPTYTPQDGLCRDNTLIMVRITILKYFTLKGKKNSKKN